MECDAKNQENSGGDKGLVALFLKMSPDERLQANDIHVLDLKVTFDQ